MAGKRSLVHGVGINDWVGNTHIDGKDIKEYVLWKDMLGRCFYEGYKQKYPAYEGVTC